MRFEVLLNGKSLCIAGTPDFGVLSAIVTRVKRNPDDEKLVDAPDRFFKEFVELSVGGLDSSERKSLHWLRECLKQGDEVTIRVLKPGEYDAPQEEAGNDA